MTGLSRDHGAWQVKSMGDGAMIWAPDAARAVALAADTLDERWDAASTCCQFASASTQAQR